MNSEKLLDSFNKHCMEQDDCEHCKYNCINKSDILECGIWYGYNKAIDDFTDYIRPIISEYVCALKNNRYAFIDIDEINRKLKVGASNE